MIERQTFSLNNPTVHNSLGKKEKWKKQQSSARSIQYNPIHIIPANTTPWIALPLEPLWVEESGEGDRVGYTLVAPPAFGRGRWTSLNRLPDSSVSLMPLSPLSLHV
jgi:hypothetical protein